MKMGREFFTFKMQKQGYLKNYLGGLGIHTVRMTLNNFISVRVLSGNRNHISSLNRKK